MKQLDPKLYQLVVGGVPISGYSDDSMIKVSRLEDAWNLTVGADGEGTRTKTNNKSGQIEISLKQSSASNAHLSSLALADELENAGLVPSMVKDGNGNSIYMAEQSYVKKHADAELNKTATDRVWIIETDALQMLTAGN